MTSLTTAGSAGQSSGLGEERDSDFRRPLMGGSWVGVPPARGFHRWNGVPGRCAIRDQQPFVLRSATNLGQASTLPSGKSNCSFLRHFSQTLHPEYQTWLWLIATLTLTVTCLYPHIISGKACYKLVTCQYFSLGLIWARSWLCEAGRRVFPPPLSFPLSSNARAMPLSLWELPGFIWTEWIFLPSWVHGKDVTFELVSLLITLNMMMLIKII